MKYAKLLFSLMIIAGLALAMSGTKGQVHSDERTESGWGRYELDDRAVMVSCPAKLTENTAANTDSSGPTNHTFSATYNTVVFVVQYSILPANTDDWPEAVRASFYDGFWKSFSAGLEQILAQKTELSETNSVTINNLPAKEFLFTIGSWKGRVKVTIVAHRSYAVAILATPNLYDEFSDKFLNSLTIRPDRARAAREPTLKRQPEPEK